MTTEEKIYRGRDNIVVLSLYSDNVIIDHTGITRVVLILNNGQEVDSQVHPELFNLTKEDSIELKIGTYPNLRKGGYTADLVIYDADNVNGVVWGNIRLTVR